MPETGDARPQAQAPAMAAMRAEFERGLALHQQGKLADAERIYQEVLHQQPRHFDALHLLGVIALQTQRTELGAELILKAIALNPSSAAAHNNLGKALLDLKQSERALASYDRAVALKPDYAEAHSNRGNALRELKRPAEALTSYDRAIALNPDYATAYNNRGVALTDLKRLEDALASFEIAITLKPDYAEAHDNRGNALLGLRRPAEALASYERAIALKPDFAGANSNRGNALSDLMRPADALASHDRAIALKPNDAVAHNNRGNALRDLKRPEEALASYQKSIALDPDYANAQHNLSLCQLLLGRFEPGWRVYEWRKKCDVPSATHAFPRPLWLGEHDIAGKTLFLWWEQGYGDTIQFSRYAKLAQARGAKVVMSVQQPLHRLLKQIGPSIEIVGPDQAPAKFDYHCPLLSLPLAFRTTLETIPAQQVLKADAKLRAAWAARLPPKSKPRIGLVWSGTTNHKNDHYRSTQLDALLPILSADADWICLQKEIRENDLARLRKFGRIAFFGDALRDFGDTAALLELLDLVVTVDTSVAHLAGAMGKPVWILLPCNPDWRWLLDRDDSPWYPSARLFRQQEIGNWAKVIDRVGNELRPMVG